MRGKEVEGKNGEQVRGGDDEEETRGRQKYKLGRTGENRQHRENVKRRQERWTERKNTRGQRWKEEEEEVHPKEVLLPTVEELSEWRSPPPQRPSAQTQTGPAGRQRRGTKERRKVKNRHEGAKTPGKQDGLVTGLNSALPKSPSARR